MQQLFDFIGNHLVLVSLLVAISLLLILRHKTNLRNLLAGKEARFGKQDAGVRIQDSEKSADG